jgi:hypothetical protein
MGTLAVLGAFLLFAIAAWLWGADSRPGFDGGGDDRKVRFFFHSKTD